MTQTYNIALLNDDTILHVTLNEDYNIYTDMPYSNGDTLAVLDKLDAPVVLITEIRMKMTFDQLLLGTKSVAVGEDATWRHPNVAASILVTTDPTVYKAAAGLKTDTFGNLDIPVFHTAEEAIAAAKQLVNVA